MESSPVILMRIFKVDCSAVLRKAMCLLYRIRYLLEHNKILNKVEFIFANTNIFKIQKYKNFVPDLNL